MDPDYIPEPELYFGKGERHIDPKLGLLIHGPAGEKLTELPQPRIFRTGIIGTPSDIDEFHRWLRTMREIIYTDEEYSVNFPGIGIDGPLKFDFLTGDDWEFFVSTDELKDLNQDTRKESIDVAILTIEKKLEAISNLDPPLEYIAIILPNIMLEECSDPDLKLKRIRFGSRVFGDLSPDYIDLHNAIKAIAMKFNLKTQMLHPNTVRFETNQPADITAWNLAVAAYYKGTGVPWKIADIKDDTCYVGISFYQEAGQHSEMRSSMAQVFLRSGESLVLRGDPFPVPERTMRRSTSLTQVSAEKILEQVLEQYKLVKNGTTPRRLVIHKSSPFTEEEINVFANVGTGSTSRDYIAIRSTTTRFYTDTEYPPLRGTFIKTKLSKMFLFTTGFIPILDTYPGHRVPTPLLLDPGRLDSKPTQICKEILALTKLDWNDSNFCEKLPVTIGVSRSVGNVLAETRAKEIIPEHEYRYYM